MNTRDAPSYRHITKKSQFFIACLRKITTCIPPTQGSWIQASGRRSQCASVSSHEHDMSNKHTLHSAAPMPDISCKTRLATSQRPPVVCVTRTCLSCLRHRGNGDLSQKAMEEATVIAGMRAHVCVCTCRYMHIIHHRGTFKHARGAHFTRKKWAH